MLRGTSIRTVLAVPATALTLALIASACAGRPAATAQPSTPSPSPSASFDDDPGAIGSIITGAKARAADREAQNAARNGLVAAMVFYIDNDETYRSATGDDLEVIEPTLTFASGRNSTGPDVVSFSAKDQQITLTVLSLTGACFAIRSDETAAVSYGYRDRPDGCRPTAFAAGSFGPTW